MKSANHVSRFSLQITTISSFKIWETFFLFLKYRTGVYNSNLLRRGQYMLIPYILLYNRTPRKHIINISTRYSIQGNHRRFFKPSQPHTFLIPLSRFTWGRFHVLTREPVFEWVVIMLNIIFKIFAIFLSTESYVSNRANCGRYIEYHL